MKKITLHGPTVRNDGGYVDAGATLAIGDKPDEIAADRAKDLVERGVALSETAKVGGATPKEPSAKRKAKPRAPTTSATEPLRGSESVPA